MTQEDKDLLLRDLSTRLPYGVKLGFYAEATKQTYTCTLLGLEPQDEKPVIAKTDCGNFCILADHVKPYLFPMSSMTEEQREELFIVVLDEQVSISDCSFNDMTGYSEILTNYIIDAIDWFNKNHFDYRGLIPMGLALDATGLNIY